ncbi:MAG: hypothetical protein JXI32_09495 [Deltaproteobacteria bacterium]|nr:hypothetical protein [Deltaproteobacteria bacterium]
MRIDEDDHRDNRRSNPEDASETPQNRFRGGFPEGAWKKIEQPHDLKDEKDAGYRKEERLERMQENNQFWGDYERNLRGPEEEGGRGKAERGKKTRKEGEPRPHSLYFQYRLDPPVAATPKELQKQKSKDKYCQGYEKLPGFIPTSYIFQETDKPLKKVAETLHAFLLVNDLISRTTGIADLRHRKEQYYIDLA